jgi:hypothetical protein
LKFEFFFVIPALFFVIPTLFFVIPTLFFCHPGLEPGSSAHSRPLQRAVVNTGSRVFARDDKEGTTTQASHTSSGRITGKAHSPTKTAPEGAVFQVAEIPQIRPL